MKFCAFLVCLLFMERSCVLGDNAHDHHDEETNQKPEVMLPKFSCVMMKSFAYGLQKAVHELSLGGPESNLSRAVRDIDVEHYLRDVCPAEETPKHPETGTGAKKVKRNQHSSHSATSKSKLTNLPYLPANPPAVNMTLTNPAHAPAPAKEGSAKGVTHQEHQQLKFDEFERLLRNFEEVTNALKSQLTQHAKHEHAERTHAVNAANPLQNVAKPTNLELSTASNATKSLTPVAAIQTVKNDTKLERSRHAHSHNHKKHKNAKSKASKSKGSKETKDAFTLDEDNLTDDRHVSERLKQEQQEQQEQNIEKIEILPREYTKHQVKRSLKMKNDKFNNKSSKSKSKFNKTDRKTKTKGKTYHKSR